jgi:hypothetical protein
MKKMSFIMTMMLLFVLSACTSSEEKLLKATYDNMQDMYNAELDFTIKIKGADINESMKMKALMDMESDTKGLMKMTMDQGEMDIESYFVFNKDDVTFYMNMSILGQTWLKGTESMSKFESSGDSVDTDLYLDALKENTSMTKLDDATLSDGTKVKVFEIKVENAEGLLEEVFGEEDMSFGLSDEEMTDLFNNIVYKFYIDAEEKLVRKIDIDMTEVMNNVLEAAKETERFDEISISVEFSNFGNVDVVIPENVKSNAVDAGNILD